MRERVFIVGGGVIGLSLAWQLSREGLAVTVIERDAIGKATSWAAAGILPPANFDRATDPIDRLRGFSHQLFPKWADELQSITGIDVGLRRCGGWYLADTRGEQASMLGMTGYWDELDIRCESVPVADVARREPAIASWIQNEHANGKAANEQSAGEKSAWWVPDEYQIRPPRYLQALHQACLIEGATFIEGVNVSDLYQDGDHAFVTVNDGTRYEADAVVVCGGAWTGSVADRLQLHQSLIPVRGQILLLKTDQPLLKSVVNVGQRYVMCRDDGSTLVGSCEEEVGFQLGTDSETLAALKSFAVDLIPELSGAKELASWSGLRPLTFDGFPMIGRVPSMESVYVASGHFRSGFHLSPGTAIAMTQLILNQTPTIDLGPFRVGKQQHLS